MAVSYRLSVIDETGYRRIKRGALVFIKEQILYF